MNSFQTIIIAVFILALVLGVLIFAGVLPGFRAPAGGAGGAVLWWGTIPTAKLNPLLETIRRGYDEQFTLTYVEKNAETLESDLVEALALGRGPDLVILPSNLLLRQAAKLQPLSYDWLSHQNFRETFVIGAHLRDWELLLGPTGALGLPLYVDPLVLYYNQDILANAKVPFVPRTWREVAETNRLLTQTDSRGDIMQSAMAIGSFNNVFHAKEILAMLVIQAGNTIVARQNGLPAVTLKDNLGTNRQPAGEAISFFLRFTDPANTLYSWNSSQPEALEAFSRGRLALYFGFGSEIERISARNPQLNFAVSEPPQRVGDPRQLTIGRFYFLALTRGSRNPNTALQVASLLSGKEFGQMISEAAALPPARNDLLQSQPADPHQAVLYRVAVITRDWLDPAPDKTYAIFRGLVEAVALGRTDLSQAINNAHAELENLLPKNEAN